MQQGGTGSYEDELRAVLPVAGLGEPLRFLPEATSTNDEALALAGEGAPQGALVVADHQTAGRGRRGRSWHAPPGSALLFSLVLRPQLAPERLGLLTTALGVAGAEATRDLGVDAHIKWPNDIVVGERKLAGVLVESRLAGDAVTAVAGLGLNVSVAKESLPEEVRAAATSLSEHLAVPPSRAKALRAILDRLAVLLPELAGPAPDVTDRAEGLSSVLGKDVILRKADGSTLTGRASRLTETGALVVMVAREPIEVTAGEIERLRPL